MCSQTSLDIEDCENKVEGVGQQELCCNWLDIYVDVISAVGRNLRI